MVILGWIAGSQATLIRRLNLEDMVARADRIVVGTVVKVSDDETTGEKAYPTTVIEFSVSDTLKGQHAKTVKLRQLSNRKKTRLSAMIQLPVFHPGETVVVFLSKPSPIGMTSPVGFEQGVFRVPTKPGSKPSKNSPVLNGTQNHDLLAKVTSSKLKAYAKQKKIDPVKGGRPVTLGQLKEMIGLVEKAPR